MVVSLIDIQRGIIADAIRNATRGDWMVLVVDATSRKLLDNVIPEDDILSANITHIEQIEDRRPMNKDMDVIYLLTPETHIVECLLADFDRRRYRGAYLLWTSLPNPSLRQKVDRSNSARQQIKVFNVLGIGYYPRESHVVTFRDPWSFPVLFHPSCNNLVKDHLEDLAQRIVSVCVSLGEYPIIRYYRPQNATHEASVLCSHLARFVQDQIDMYAQYHQDFPPQSNRPRGALYIVDRSMDIAAPFLHEFTYQAMAHDLLPIVDGEKITYKTVLNEGHHDEEEKEMEISEKDNIWVENRHRHMKDTIEKLMGDFRKFIESNPNFTRSDGKNANSLNAIKDMLAGLPEFQEMKAAYNLHLSMAQECMSIFENQNLPDLASVEQTLATGLDEDYRKPKNVADQVVRILDEEAIAPADRLRLIALYLLFKDGVLPSDIGLLLAHAQLPPQDREVLQNLDLLGAKVHRELKDSSPPPHPLFPRPNASPSTNGEEYALSRFSTNVKRMLEDHVRGSLDQNTFPFTKPNLDAEVASQDTSSNASLRSAKPTWAKSRLASTEPRQRIIVFMAGGATYSESRACYEVSRATSRDVFLATSHMLTPSLFLKQVGDLSVEKRRLKIPAEQPKPKAPAHIFEQEQGLGLPPKPQAGSALPTSPGPRRPAGGLPGSPAPPTSAMNNMSLNSGGGRPPNSGASSYSSSGPGGGGSQYSSGYEKDKKKKHHFFGSKK